MDVTKIPFNEYLSLTLSSDSRYQMMLSEKDIYQNHLSTVHASAQFALAEATSGYFLTNEFSDLTGIIPVVRKVDVKYKKPANGKIFSKARFYETTKEEISEALTLKNRVLLKVEVLLYDTEDKNVMQAVFEWFVTKG